MSAARPFDLLGPLPRGTTVLEASAGTGKTFTIAGLVTRAVAEGVTPLEQLLVVTFGRAATQELRERVRERLVTARDALAEPGAGESDDPLVRHLAAADPAEVAVRQRRLVEACARYDAATVVTTHGFCEQVLRSLGTAGDVDDDVVLVEDLDDLTVEVVDDFYVRKWGVSGAPAPVMTYAESLALARAAVRDPGAALAPAGSDDEVAATRHAFAVNVRREVERRKRTRRVIGFDDLLTRLRATLADPRSGPAARARLRQRFSTVLVDEFQDTDPVQWEILRTAFHGHATLVLVGDPKQAIYAFRGADVFAYLDAEAAADHRRTLDHNWRSDPDLLRGLAALFRGASLGDPRIVVTDVAAGRSGRSLATPGAPVRLRMLRSGDQTTVGPLREAVTADLVAEIVDQLQAGTVLIPRGGAPRPVEPGDIAVIVRTGAQLELVHAALLAAGVPAVRRTTSSVFLTPAARDWTVLLEALEQPHRTARLRRLALTAFVGWDAAELDRTGVDALGERLRWWITVHAERGVAALFETVSRDRDLAGRLLERVDGERTYTDLRHVGEALHAASMAEQLGLTAGLEWLRHRVKEAGKDSAVERSRRLDSDAAAVQCVTIHASKGLEFPVVHVPFGWDRWVNDRVQDLLPVFHEGSQRVLDVGGIAHRGFAESLRRSRSEDFGEDLRLLYVALTRAQAQVTAWWAPSGKNTRSAPLHRLLFGGPPELGVPEEVPVPGDTAAFAAASAWAVAGALDVVPVPVRPAVTWTRPAGAATTLARATLDRTLDTAWRRTSYTSLTAAVHDARPAIGSEPEIAEKDDEPELPAPTDSSAGPLRDIASPWADLPGGATFGTTVHAVLETFDPSEPDLAATVRAGVGTALGTYGAGSIDPEALSAALLQSVRTPLGPLLDERALVDVAPADRLAELEFELPLGGGETPRASSTLGDLAAVWRRHVPATDPLGRYADLLADPALGAADLRGYLTGSIDAVLRVDGRHVVVDYKTNRLGVPELPLTAWDYRAAAMADAMLQAHYPLQALLYEVALHRFLRWRLADYAPARHLGGVLYLFLRGMCGPGVREADGAVPGVFAWHPPAELVVEASDVLAGASR